ncbi:PDZ domain-containing protein GIPC3 [Musca vetustissima]|uniref:PDZ domain-containing protein GIPC3 n=1 Tax=Musca vetustissima TaxID=27455 RepID=UPI002AB6A782|nr:PDZ domain-containing protein GIPC3 [Musca vetustissima]
MPLFAKKVPKPTIPADSVFHDNNNGLMSNGKVPPSQQQQQQNGNYTQRTPSISESNVQKPQLVFHCQLAHGSPTGLITGFASVRELYKKIAECYDIPAEEILFCTLNSHKVDMTKLLGGQIGLDDFIGAGFAFIKRIKEGSIIDRIEHILVGDHIEKLNGESMVGKRHYEVARLLKEIPTGSSFTLRLVEPMRSGFQGIGPRSQSRMPSGRGGYGSGKETLRFKANGNVEIEEKFDDSTQAGIEAINNLLESFMGINDAELATQIWDLGADKTNSMDFAEAIDNSDLESFGFTDDFIIELWGAITDARRKKSNK